MPNHLKILFLTLALVSISNCYRYEDSEETFDSEYAKTSTINYKGTTVKHETMKDKYYRENKIIHRKGIFDYETVINEEKGTEKPKTDETNGTIIETTRSWITETPKYYENATKRTDEMKDYCTYFKYGGAFDYKEMADVWQVAYFQASEKVHCFKIHIKLVSAEEKNALAARYGSFNDKVKWKRCNLEIRSSTDLLRSHYLQGDNTHEGVLENIIIRTASSEAKGENEITSSLQSEVPDQWMVFKNLLLMRDCETGHTVVFSRVPNQATFGDILDALKEFGEEDKIGRLACADDEVMKPFDTDEDGIAAFD